AWVSDTRLAPAGCLDTAGLEGLPRDPLAQQRVDDDVAVVLPRDDVFARQRDERRLHRRRPAEPMTRARIGRHQVQTLFDDARAQPRALSERRPLPYRLEHRLLLEQQALERGVEIVERRLAPPARLDLVPRLVRQALDVVGEIAGELDDRGAEAVQRL